MGLIEDLFGDDNILATPVDRFVLDANNNCENRLIPNIPPTDDNESWDRYGEMQDGAGPLAAALFQMDNIKKNGGDLNQCEFGSGPPLQWALEENRPSVIEISELSSSFTKNADFTFLSEDNNLRDEISQFIWGHGHEGIVSQLKLQSDEFITYLIDSVHNKLESSNTEKEMIEPIVQMAVLDFSTDVVDPGDLAIYTVYIFCRLENGYDDDDNDIGLIKEIRLDTHRTSIQVDLEDWADWAEENEEDCTRACELRRKFICQYGPEGFFET